MNLAAIACGGREAIERTPAVMGVVNPNSPLVWDRLMVDALTEWASANQPVIVTPFLLAGATAPVSVAAGLSLEVAEALSGVALIQAIRPGAPCLFGSFFTAVDMRSGGARTGHSGVGVRHASPAGSWPATTASPTAAAADCAPAWRWTPRRRARR